MSCRVIEGAVQMQVISNTIGRRGLEICWWPESGGGCTAVIELGPEWNLVALCKWAGPSQNMSVLLRQWRSDLRGRTGISLTPPQISLRFLFCFGRMAWSTVANKCFLYISGSVNPLNIYCFFMFNPFFISYPKTIDEACLVTLDKKITRGHALLLF